jgi:hypothetical protein
LQFEPNPLLDFLSLTVLICRILPVCHHSQNDKVIVNTSEKHNFWWNDLEFWFTCVQYCGEFLNLTFSCFCSQQNALQQRSVKRRIFKGNVLQRSHHHLFFASSHEFFCELSDETWDCVFVFELTVASL